MSGTRGVWGADRFDQAAALRDRMLRIAAEAFARGDDLIAEELTGAVFDALRSSPGTPGDRPERPQ